MANAEMKIFEAEKLHQLMIVAVSIIPIMPLERTKNKQKVRLDHFNSLHRYMVLQVGFIKQPTDVIYGLYYNNTTKLFILNY